MEKPGKLTVKMRNDMRRVIQATLKESARIKIAVARDKVDTVQAIAESIIVCYRTGGKVLFCGNGGSAADAQHLAAELMGRFKLNRQPLSAIALTTNTSILTAVANDYGYEHVFSRQVEALATERDVIISISTSGNSPNVIEAINMAKQRGAKTIALTGKGGGTLAEVADLALIIPSDNTAIIQEAHIAIGHIICELVERALFSGDS